MNILVTKHDNITKKILGDVNEFNRGCHPFGTSKGKSREFNVRGSGMRLIKVKLHIVLSK
jgi:hypothetical protein